MPVLVGVEWLIEPATLARRHTAGSADQAGTLQHSVDGCWTGGNYISIDHHKRASAISIQGVLGGELDNRVVLPTLEPVIAGNQGVMLVGLAVSLLPAEVLAVKDPDPEH